MSVLIQPTPSPACIAMVQEFEGFRFKAYKDAGNRWTLGWGTHIKPDGTRVKQGEEVSKELASQWLALELVRITQEVLDRELPDMVWKQHEVDALCSFVYNIGQGAFKRSTMLRLLKAGDKIKAAEQFERWVYAGGQRSKGLLRRRRKEKSLFLGLL